MTTLTIIKDDGYVAVDGVGFQPLDCSSLSANIHAIQFDGTNGWVEYNDGTANLAITAISDYSAITDLWTSTNDSLSTELSDTNSEKTTEKATYDWKRQWGSAPTYASVGDQLDQQYKDAVNGTTTWKDAIAAVKAAHPKP